MKKVLIALLLFLGFAMIAPTTAEARHRHHRGCDHVVVYRNHYYPRYVTRRYYAPRYYGYYPYGYRSYYYRPYGYYYRPYGYYGYYDRPRVAISFGF